MLDVLRHQDLEGVIATVVRYYGGVKLGGGGLLRAYTDCIAQALRTAQKIPIIKQRTLRCQVPYTLEGLLRRKIDATGATLKDVQHGVQVAFVISLPETAADDFVSDLNESGQGNISWPSEPVG